MTQTNRVSRVSNIPRISGYELNPAYMQELTTYRHLYQLLSFELVVFLSCEMAVYQPILRVLSTMIVEMIVICWYRSCDIRVSRAAKLARLDHYPFTPVWLCVDMMLLVSTYRAYDLTTTLWCAGVALIAMLVRLSTRYEVVITPKYEVPRTRPRLVS